MDEKYIFPILLIFSIFYSRAYYKDKKEKGGCIGYGGLILVSVIINMFTVGTITGFHHSARKMYLIYKYEGIIEYSYIVPIMLVSFFFLAFSIGTAEMIAKITNKNMDIYYKAVKTIAFYFIIPFVLIVFDLTLICIVLEKNISFVTIFLLFPILVLSLVIEEYITKLRKNGIPKF